MKLTQKIISSADEIIRIKSESEIPFTNMLKIIATKNLRQFGFYAFKRGDIRVLAIAEYYTS